MKITKATQSYEAWLGKRITLLAVDLKRKHEAMAQDVFPFLRATFYRWMQLWPEVAAEEDRAPKVLAVGDLHVENFGTWRDVEGRLVWGINDFDEAYVLPYTIDLVRLAASAHIAIREARLQIGPSDACDAILSGYKKGLQMGGAPIVLAEQHPWLREMMTGVLREPQQFWGKMDALPRLRSRVPKSAVRAIERLLPKKDLEYRIVHRIAGLGSLGRERFVAVALFEGAKIAREAKALAPSACVWAAGGKASQRICYQQILDRSVRAIDPFVRLKGRWIVRRLAPDCSRVELTSMPRERDEGKLLHAMGFETANVHLGTPREIKAIVKDMNQRPARWLHEAAAKMVKAITRDWRDWRSR
ncbi:MAG TPA: DUF2252 family protein [Bryobacteraceae bacterium]|jgi:uncharacterized protein (DUF2252 family)|nr:DUF2252 family protein [Bryobacteraceae bacterium]